MQSSSEQPLVGEERYVTTRITAAKETTCSRDNPSDIAISRDIIVWSYTKYYPYENLVASDACHGTTPSLTKMADLQETV